MIINIFSIFIGPRPIEFQPNYPNQQNHQPPNLRRELPDLSSEGIRKEAELVLAQAESVKCRAKGSNDITGGRVNIRTRGPIDIRKGIYPLLIKIIKLKKKLQSIYLLII